MLGSRFTICGSCLLVWAPGKAGRGARACPRCHGRGRRAPEPFLLGAALLAAGLALGGARLASAPPAAPAASPAGDPRAAAKPAAAPADQARTNARLVLAVASGPRRGGTVTLRKGQAVKIVRREGATLLVQDGEGNRMYVARNQLTAP